MQNTWDFKGFYKLPICEKDLIPSCLALSISMFATKEISQREISLRSFIINDIIENDLFERSRMRFKFGLIFQDIASNVYMNILLIM